MRFTRKFGKKTLAILMTAAMLLTIVSSFSFTAVAADTEITYSYSGSDKDTAGYAEGTITVSSGTAGKYSLYWANDENALDGYYPIAELNVSAGGSAQFKFGNHTAIPAGATKIIATTTADKTVDKASGIYTIPSTKRLAAGKRLYKFNSYSDVHIADDNWYKNCEKNWAQALKFGVDKETDFIVSSGDLISFGREAEWERYERILANSDYVNPVYESNGNHDIRDDVTKGNKTFVKASGTDNTIANYDANKPYYYVTEKSTGDLFIFMALESNTNPGAADEFSSAQMTWLKNLLDKYYDTGINIYLIEHAPINGFGAGDRMSNPYYKAHLSENYDSTVQFKALLKKYPNLIWMSGHTHLDLSLNYNYSNENGTACNMIHNPAVAGSTKANSSDNGLDYNDGYGFNSQGYYVEAYEEQIIYYGANLTDELIYPAYSYIMRGARSASEQETNPTSEAATIPTTSDDYKFGDVNLDKAVNVRDATIILKYAVKLVDLSPTQLSKADVNADNNVNVRDATDILKYAAGIITKFKAEYNDETPAKKTVYALSAGTLAQSLTNAKSHLDSLYTFASYNQYQALKEYYYQYKNQASADETVLAKFDTLIAELNEIATHIGSPVVVPVGDTYYFENTNNWAKVKCYAWGSSANAAWPGVDIQKVGTNYGHDVYGIKFSSSGQYTHLIFNDGTSNGAKTTDIVLSSYEGNCFYLDGGSDSKGLTVKSFTYSGGETPTTAPATTQPVSPDKHYALCYYNSTAHSWSNIDTFFTPNSDGTYVLKLVTKNSDDVSLNVYDNSTGTFNCIAASTKFTYASGSFCDYTLTGSPSRGKSITISGLSVGLQLAFLYNPADNTLKVTCGV